MNSRLSFSLLLLDSLVEVWCWRRYLVAAHPSLACGRSLGPGAVSFICLIISDNLGWASRRAAQRNLSVSPTSPLPLESHPHCSWRHLFWFATPLQPVKCQQLRWLSLSNCFSRRDLSSYTLLQFGSVCLQLQFATVFWLLNQTSWKRLWELSVNGGRQITAFLPKIIVVRPLLFLARKGRERSLSVGGGGGV